MTRSDRSIHDPHTKQHLTFIETATDTETLSARAIVRLEPGGFVPRHLHLRQDEHLEVLSGSIRLRAGGKNCLLQPGDRAAILRRRLHAIANAGQDDATFVLEVDPARHIEYVIRSTFALGRVLHPLERLGLARRTNRKTEMRSRG